MPEPKKRAERNEAAKSAKRELTGSNPFVSHVAPTRVYRRKAIAGMKVPNKDGVEVQAFYDEAVYNDTEPFVKVFKRGYQAMKFLGAAGIKVLEYVLDQLKPSNTIVHLSQAEYVRTMNQKPSNYYVGLNELMSAQFLAPTTEKGFYYINPAFFFSGDRLNMRHEFLFTKSDKEKP